MGGIAYAWSVFVVPMQNAYGWTRADAMLPLSVFLVVFTGVGMILGGALQDRFGPRRVAVAGGLLLLLAYLMAAQIDRFPYVWWLVLTYGLIGGLGGAFAYSVSVPTARKWFPDRTAFAIAFAVTGFGLAAVIFAPLITRLIDTTGIPNTFLVLGAISVAVCLFAAWLLREPPAGWTPSGKDGQPLGSITMFASRTESTLREALRQPLFYLLWLGFFSVMFGGLLAMAHMVPYGVSILELERPVAAIALVFFALANGFGRPIAGLIAEKTGPVNVMLGTYIIIGVAFLLFNSLATTPQTLYLFAFIFGWGFAVSLALFPTLTTIAFGVTNLGAVYGAGATAFAVAAFFGPMVGGWAYDLHQSYVLPFAIAGTFALVGWVICLLAYKLKYRLP
jgi:OFA family oxalate/formate antiporter-like MFS transporter